MSEYSGLKVFKKAKAILCGFLLSTNCIFSPPDNVTWRCHCKTIRIRSRVTFLYVSFSFTCRDIPIKAIQIKRIRTRVFVLLFAPEAFCSDAYSEHRRATSTTFDPLSHHPTQRLFKNLQCIPPHVNRVSMTHMSGAIQFTGRLDN